MRRVIISVLLIAVMMSGMLVLVPKVLVSKAATPELCTDSKNPIQVGVFGKLTADKELWTEPQGGTVIETVSSGMEFQVVDGPIAFKNKLWWSITTIASGSTGWINESDDRSNCIIQVAVPNSTAAVRQYDDGFCSATPAKVFHENGKLTQEFQHRVVFDDSIDATQLKDANLLFNTTPLDTKDYKLDTDQGVQFQIRATWVLQNELPFSGPKWDQKGYWQLVWHCPDPLPVPATPSATAAATQSQ